MKTFYSLDQFGRARTRTRRCILTIGVFDGVHRAHRKVIQTAVRKARRGRVPSCAITFHPHPAAVTGSSRKVPLLISLKHRLRLLCELGLEYAIVMRFGKRLSRMSADDFIVYVMKKIRTREIIVGRDFAFGRNREGSLDSLKRASKEKGYRVTAVQPVVDSGRTISSTWIRTLISSGSLKKAEALLARPVSILGTVIEGHRRGRILGFPTANIDPHHEAIPPSGVYAVKVRIKRTIYAGVLNIGIRPTFARALDRENTPSIEVHIFDFNNSLYGKDLEILFLRKIRDERKFKDRESLRRQIEKDAAYAQRMAA